MRLLIALFCTSLAAFNAWAESPSSANKQHDNSRHRMSWLDNGVIRLGVDLDLGGAITYLGRSGRQENLINSWDWGRQVQMSFYSGPVPYEIHGKTPPKVWNHIGWNPIQAGDCYGNGSKVLDCRNDGKSIYVKSIPMQWPLENEPGECTYAWTIALRGAVAEVSAELQNRRSDTTQYPARGQELPAVYVNGPWYRLITYTGDQAWTKDAVAELDTTKHLPNCHWISWNPTEHWAALVDNDGFGLGLWHPGCGHFSGGFVGTRGHGGPRDGQTGYLAANFNEVLDYNIRYDYRFCLILGTVDEIRAAVYQREQPQKLPAYVFKEDRQHWAYHKASDTGWPIRGELKVSWTQDDPQLVGPHESWPASNGSTLRIEAAMVCPEKMARVYWARSDEPAFSESKSMAFPIIPDGEYHVYDVPLHDSPEYRGTITRLRLDPAAKGNPASALKLRSIMVR